MTWICKKGIFYGDSLSPLLLLESLVLRATPKGAINGEQTSKGQPTFING